MFLRVLILTVLLLINLSGCSNLRLTNLNGLNKLYTLPSDNVKIIVTTTQVRVSCLFASVINRDDPSLLS